MVFIVLEIIGIIICVIACIAFLYSVLEDDSTLCVIFGEIFGVGAIGISILLGTPIIALILGIILLVASIIFSIFYMKEAHWYASKNNNEDEKKTKARSVLYGISTTILLAIVVGISLLLWKDRYRTNFNMKTLDAFPQDVLKNGYYYVSKNLKLTRIVNSIAQTDDAGKIILESGTVKNEVIISNKTKGKLLEVKDSEDGYTIKVQFDTDENCYLLFLCKKKKSFLENNDGKVIYNGFEYAISTVPYLIFEAIEKKSETTVSTEAQGAW